MADNPEVSTAELLSRIQQGWESLQAYIKPLTPEQLMEPTDAAGWTVKDHLIHLAVWADGFDAVLRGENRTERMGLTPEQWATDDFDIMNAVIQQQHRDQSLSDVLQTLEAVHQRLVAKIQTFTDADLMRPYSDFQPASASQNAVIWSIVGNTYGHYAEHIPWMDAIVNGDRHEILSKDELLAAIEAGWNALNAYLDSLTDEQLTQPTDLAGWTVKDHLAHLAAWEDSMNALLDRQPRREYMGIDQPTWDSRDIDAINTVIQQRYRALPLRDVRQMMRDVHERLLPKLQPLYDWDLQRPFKYYQPGSTQDRPAIIYLAGDTCLHYAEHLPWMQAIVSGDKPEQLSKAELLAAIDTGWNEFTAYRDSLTAEQLTQPTDAAGWTAKDHIAHLAIWEDSINALFDKVPRWEHMGIDHGLWNSQDWDAVNAVIQRRYHDITLADLKAMWSGIHDRLVATVKALSDADLRRPYSQFQPDSSLDWPVIHWIIIDTYQHYAEHKTYIDVILNPKA